MRPMRTVSKLSFEISISDWSMLNIYIEVKNLEKDLEKD